MCNTSPKGSCTPCHMSTPSSLLNCRIPPTGSSPNFRSYCSSTHIGELLPGGTGIAFLVRALRRHDDGINLQAPGSYGKWVNATGTSSTTRRENCTSIVSAADRKTSRRVVGKLLWVVPLRPDLSYVAKELSRTLSSPTEDDFAMLKHIIRYLKRTKDHRISIVPKNIADTDVTFDVTTSVYSDGPGCTTTRTSTTGRTITVRGVAVHHYSRTQATVALSSGGTELHGLSSGMTETIGLLQFHRECNVKTNGFVALATDSAAGNSMASRLGVSPASKHIQD